jgi:hypothetical protein
VLSPTKVELVADWGDTFINATAEAQLRAQTCQAPGNRCQPTPLSLRRIASEHGCGASVEVGWRRAGDLKDADRYVAELQRLAATRELFDCSGSVCLAVVPTILQDERQSDVDTFSVCEVEVVQGVSGPPSRCQEALKQQKRTGVLLRGNVGSLISLCSMGLRDFDAVFKNKADNLSSVRKLVDEVLRAKPFNLTVMEDGDALIGTRAHLASEVLAGWREWVTVRVEIRSYGADASATIYTNMLVSKQATTSREAWSPPSEPQEAAYLLTLRNEFQRRGGLLRTGGPR